MAFFRVILETYLTYQVNHGNPVTLLLIDINMPILTGIEALKLIKQNYDKINVSLAEQNRPKLVRPAICYYSQYNKRTMELFMKDDELADFYLEKPVPSEDISALFTLLNIVGQESQN